MNQPTDREERIRLIRPSQLKGGSLDLLGHALLPIIDEVQFRPNADQNWIDLKKIFNWSKDGIGVLEFRHTSPEHDPNVLLRQLNFVKGKFQMQIVDRSYISTHGKIKKR